MDRIHTSSLNTEWYTPKWFLELVYEVLGEVDLDPCSNIGTPAVLSKRRYTKDTNGLLQPWYGKVYLNPPYGREMATWTTKLIEEYLSGRTTEAILLAPARTDTRWFNTVAKNTMCFIKGRIRFELNGIAKDPSCFPSVAVYLGVADTKFVKTFEQIGNCMRRQI